jgi:hypothetical protein
MIWRLLREERGMALGLAIIVVVIVGVMGAGLLTFVATDLQRIAAMLASCLALLTYHLIVGTFSLLFGTRVRLLMHPWPHPVQYQRNTL